MSLIGLIIGFLILIWYPWQNLAWGFTPTPKILVWGYTEVGKRSTAEDYQEEDADDEYTYQNYHLKLKQDISKHLNYDLSSFIYRKDYRDRDSLDNISRLFKTKWQYYLDTKTLSLGISYKEKRYKNTPGSEYDQIKIAPHISLKKKDIYAIDLTAGIDNYDYLEKGVKDQFKIFSSLGVDRYFFEKKLMLTSVYKIEQLEQEITNRKKTKQAVMGGFDYKFTLPWVYPVRDYKIAGEKQDVSNGVYKITTRLEWGQRDTKEDEERDEDFDYEFWQYYTKTEHRINPKLKTVLKYQYFKKDYVIADLDHRGFYIQKEWDYEILDDEKERFSVGLGLSHKDARYELKTGNNYRKEAFGVKAGYRRKKNWETSLSLEQNFYDLNDSNNDKERTLVLLSGEKLFFEGDLVLSLDLKYRYTDYKQQDDLKTKGIRLSFKYKSPLC